MAALQTKIHRLEAQRNANRVLQETQQNKLKQAIEMRQSQIDGCVKETQTNLKRRIFLIYSIILSLQTEKDDG